MSVFRREDYLLGIRHWAQWYYNHTPSFEVFRYVGHDKSQGAYYFQSTKTGALIKKGFRQLNIHGFTPFCLDWKRIQEANDALT